MRAGATLIAVALALVPVPPRASGQPPRTAAEQGPPALIGSWPGERISDGLTVYRGVLGDPATAGRWTVTVPCSPSADLGSAADAAALADRLEAAGYHPRVTEIDWPGTPGTAGRRLGRRVRVGYYMDRAHAEAAAQEIKADGFPAVAEWTGADSADIAPGKPPSARVRVTILDPSRYRGEITASYGHSLAGRETTTAMARAAGADLAVNGGYFVVKKKDGVPGVPAGIGVYDGRLLSAATGGRAALLLDGMRIARLHTALSVRAGGASREIDGINRRPGLIRDCGGVGGDEPTELPRHDVTCTDQSEIVLFTPEFGARTPRSSGIEIVLDGSGRIIDRRPPGGRVPPEGRVLSAIGDAARWLTTHAARGSRVTVEEQVLDQDDRPVDLGDGDVVNGGPWLVRAGRVYLDVEPDGIYHPDDPSFLYTWGIRRNPRTMLGVDASGRVIVVTADGRRPGYSDGLSLLEGARLMRDLGAVSAINLDGGGSVTLAVRGVLDNRPSDAGGERAVGDALLFVPAR